MTSGGAAPNIYRDILKHSAIYGAGQILSRLTSVLLLPFYTSYLRPADYGTVAVLDVAGSVLAIVTGGGLASAAARFQFDSSSAHHHRNLWWTGLSLVVAFGCLLVVSAFLFLPSVGRVLLGPTIPHAALYTGLMLPTVLMGTVEQFTSVFLRVQKASALLVTLSLARLILNVCLNIYLIAYGGLGIFGLLVGNLVASAFACFAAGWAFRRKLGAFSFDRRCVPELVTFAWPLVFTGLFSIVMHQADRYLLRLFTDLDQVGVYSLAYQIGQGVNTLVLLPFTAIWSVLVYEIAERPDSRRIYARVFEQFVLGLGALLLGVSLFSGRLISVLAASDYRSATTLVPIVCLAYFFFSLHDQLRVPVMLAKRTQVLLPVYAVAAAVNIGANLALIPVFGASGAAWASVATFVVFSLLGFERYRRIERIEYRFGRCASILAGMVLTFVLGRVVMITITEPFLSDLVAAMFWLPWAALCLGLPISRALQKVWSGKRVAPSS
jgi:O-antigen/teichoic acid export membrane protein